MNKALDDSLGALSVCDYDDNGDEDDDDDDDERVAESMDRRRRWKTWNLRRVT